jgi:N utilization substance protein B
MASNRHLGRIVALQTLYELDFRIEVGEEGLDRQEVIERNIARYSEIVDDKDFIEALVIGVFSEEAELDAFIQPLAPEWPLSQIARIDRTILRMGVWEMKKTKEVPIKVVINEAVELAKGFGADNASKFVNGVLGTAARQLGLVPEKNVTVPVAAEKKPAAKKKTAAKKKPAVKEPTVDKKVTA